MDTFFKLIVYIFIVGVMIIIGYAPRHAARRQMLYFEDCRGLFATAFVTAGIALVYTALGHIEKFIFESPEMMVVATTISLEVAYGYISEQKLSRKTRRLTIVASLIVGGLGAVRIFAAIRGEVNETHSEPNGWYAFLQAGIWIAAFVIAFLAKIIAKRSERKERHERAIKTRAARLAAIVACPSVDAMPAPMLRQIS